MRMASEIERAIAKINRVSDELAALRLTYHTKPYTTQYASLNARQD